MVPKSVAIYGDVQKHYTDSPETPVGDPEIDFFFVGLSPHSINI
jgi:hypothetical protein